MNAKLKTLKRGQTFFGAGIQWLVLGHTNSSQGLPIVTHIVSTGIVERRAFDEKNRNDLGVSTLLDYLNGEFLERLEDAFGEGAVAEQFIDLTSNDGLKDYGNVKTKVGLLTEEEYRQHRDILPPLGDEGWWWLATPYSTERAGYPSRVRRVYSDGTLSNVGAYDGDSGVRPALYLKSDISVSLDGNDESTIEVSEEELYKAAVQKFGSPPQVHPARRLQPRGLRRHCREHRGGAGRRVHHAQPARRHLRQKRRRGDGEARTPCGHRQGRLMNRRILKKRAKRFMDSFTREKIPAAFTSKEERRQYVSAFARQYVGQAAHFPETAKEAQHEHPQDEN